MTDNLTHALYMAVNGQAPIGALADSLATEARLLREALRWSPFFRRRRVCRMLCILCGDPMARWRRHKEAAEHVLANMGRGQCQKRDAGE